MNETNNNTGGSGHRSIKVIIMYQAVGSIMCEGTAAIQERQKEFKENRKKIPGPGIEPEPFSAMQVQVELGSKKLTA